MDRVTDHENLVAAQVESMIVNAMTNSERSRWAADHKIGVSDIGHCREYVRRVLVQEGNPGKESNAVMAAFVGTALGDLAERCLKEAYPEALIQAEVTVTLDVGAYRLNLPGHPDVIRPGEVMDFKSKDGLSLIARTGPTLQQSFQVVLYAKGAIDAGLVEREGLMVTLVYLDRSGADGARPEVFSWAYDEDQVEAAQQWLGDVFYAIENNEEASRDKERSWCYQWCPFAIECRGGDTDVTGLIEDEGLILAMKSYDEGRAQVRDGKKLMDAAKAELVGVSGNTEKYSARWVRIGESVKECTETEHRRAGYDRFDLTERKR